MSKYPELVYFNTGVRPSVLMGGGDFINSDSGVADTDLWTLESNDSEEDLSLVSHVTAAITGADLDSVSRLNGPSLSCSSRSLSFSSTATSDNRECQPSLYSTNGNKANLATQCYSSCVTRNAMAHRDYAPSVKNSYKI